LFYLVFIFLKPSFSEKNSLILKIAANGILIGLCCACGSTMGMPMAAVVVVVEIYNLGCKNYEY
jgi:hypothetical protein